MDIYHTPSVIFGSILPCLCNLEKINSWLRENKKKKNYNPWPLRASVIYSTYDFCPQNVYRNFVCIVLDPNFYCEWLAWTVGAKRLMSECGIKGQCRGMWGCIYHCQNIHEWNLLLFSQVEYVIEYTGKGEIAKATLNIELLNTTIDTQLLQKHMVIFQVTLSLYIQLWS